MKFKVSSPKFRVGDVAFLSNCPDFMNNRCIINRIDSINYYVIFLSDNKEDFRGIEFMDRLYTLDKEYIFNKEMKDILAEPAICNGIINE